MSPLMLSALSDAATSALFSWDYGSGTLGALKRRGWVRQVDSTPRGRKYALTDEGQKVLEAELSRV